jgi:hypothetical protein
MLARKGLVSSLTLCLTLLGTEAYSQVNTCANSSDLGCLIPNLYGSEGFVLPNPFHEAHFLSVFQSNFRPFNGAVASELTRLPIASPASGFTYVFDSATGVFTRSAQSFGPILTERAETIGRGKFFLGFAYQRFSFDSIDGIPLDNMPTVFTHEQETGAEYEKDFVTARNSVDMTLNQFTIFGTVGVTNRVDVSVAIPILDLKMKVSSDAQIHRIAPPNPTFGQAHYFDSQNRDGSIAKTFTSSGSATGIGDVIIRLKGTVKRWESSSLAVAADLYVPSGDERNFLGSGAFGLRPFIAYSARVGRVAPHFTVGYQVNQSSLLAGDISANRKGHLANQFTYTAGADVGVARPLTLAFDLLGQRVFKAARALPTTFVSPAPELSNPGAGQATYANTRFATESFNITSASAGAKLNIAGSLLLTGNLLFRLDDGGLKDKVVPLIGLSYTF